MNHSVTRRRAITSLLQAVAVVPAASLFARVAWAQDLPLLALDDPMAQALGYVEDTKDVDQAKYPKHSVDQVCDNCQFMQGPEGPDARPCTLFPGKSVKSQGWCVSWVKKA